MSCLPKNMVSISAHAHEDFAAMQVVDSEVKSKDDTTFYLGTKDDAFGIYGTFDELLEFAASIIATVYSWPIVNGRQEWLGDPITTTEGVVFSNGE